MLSGVEYVRLVTVLRRKKKDGKLYFGAFPRSGGTLSKREVVSCTVDEKRKSVKTNLFPLQSECTGICASKSMNSTGQGEGYRRRLNVLVRTTEISPMK